MIIVITGAVGQGKTIYMSYLANEIATEQNMKLYSNYRLLNSSDVNLYEKGSVIAIDEAQYSTILFDNHEENTLIVAVHDANWLKLPKDAVIINVQRENDIIIASNGDEISISEHCHLYDAFEPAYKCTV
ncbi:hypothetical protein [Lysinibacillus sp. 54212]|uniref:hypothetical protein n=1 Tax=Lysinibacillus sp. 54212 TaxID=3119829 RepID=UPI002FCB78AA